MRIWACLLAACGACAAGAAPADPAADAAIQAIQQAPDPSAAVTAYANGFALDRNNPKLYDAYVTRMVDLGLPEMAYHQAQTLTTLQANNGLAWGVVGYVDARQGRMPEALSSINLAGQFAPDNKFVQHTAGELAAWYDLKADKATIPDNTKDGLTKTRKLLDQRPAFTEAYGTAQKAYQTGTTPQPSSTVPSAPAAAPQPAPASTPPDAAAPTPTVPNAPQVPMAPQLQADQAPPLAYAPYTPAYYPDYYSPYSPYYSGAYLDWGPTYCYGWGPGWVAPAPWWWWQPCGWWGGCNFFPFGVVVAFGHDDDFHHHHGGHDGHDGHHDQFAHTGGSGHGHDPAFWHNGSSGSGTRNSFFGTPARPSDSTVHWARATATARTASTVNTFNSGAGAHRPSGMSQQSLLASTGSGFRPAQPSVSARSSTPSTPLAHSWADSSSALRAPATRPNTSASGATRFQAPATRSYNWANSSTTSRAPTTRPYSWSSRSAAAPSYVAPRTTWSAPSYRAPTYSAPRYSAPSQGFSGGFSGWRGSPGFSAAPRSFSSPSGGFHSGGSFSGGSRGGASMGGGGFHAGGGGMSGGGHGGGGHR